MKKDLDQVCEQRDTIFGMLEKFDTKVISTIQDESKKEEALTSNDKYVESYVHLQQSHRQEYYRRGVIHGIITGSLAVLTGTIIGQIIYCTKK